MTYYPDDHPNAIDERWELHGALDGNVYPRTALDRYWDTLGLTQTNATSGTLRGFTSQCPECVDAGDGSFRELVYYEETGHLHCTRCTASGRGIEALHLRLARAVGGIEHGGGNGRPVDERPRRLADSFSIASLLDECGFEFRTNAANLSLECRLRSRHIPYLLNRIAGKPSPMARVFPRMGQIGGECAYEDAYPDGDDHWCDFDATRQKAVCTVLAGYITKPSGKNVVPWQATRDALQDAIAYIGLTAPVHDPHAATWAAFPSPPDGYDVCADMADLFDGDHYLSDSHRRALEDGLRVMLASVYWRSHRPGCAADVIVTLCGASGAGKTKFLEWLFEPFGRLVGKSFVALDKNERDTVYEMHCAAATLFDEMEGVDGYRIDAIKRHGTARADQITRKWQTKPETLPRRFAMVATKNLTATTLPWDVALRRRFCFVRTGSMWHEVHSGQGLMEHLAAQDDTYRATVWGAVRDLCESGAPGWAFTESGPMPKPDTHAESCRLYTAMMNRRAQDAARAYTVEASQMRPAGPPAKGPRATPAASQPAEAPNVPQTPTDALTARVAALEEAS